MAFYIVTRVEFQVSWYLFVVDVIFVNFFVGALKNMKRQTRQRKLLNTLQSESAYGLIKNEIIST